MIDSQGIFNMQQIPGDTDFDGIPVVSDDESESPIQIPSDAVPSIVPVSEPPTETEIAEINENPKHAPRIMRAAASIDNRIY